MAARKFLTDIELDGYFDLKGNVAKKFRLEDYADNTAPTSNFVGRMIYTTSGTDRIEVYTDGGWKELAFVDELSSGSVTSVGLSLPNIFNVTNSPVTSTGTLTATLATQAANKIFAGPDTGSDAAPTFRSLVAADIPSLSYTKISDWDEAVADTIGAMVSSNTESGISVTYQDSDNTLDFDVADFDITLSGDVAGTATVTNLGNVTISTTIQSNSVALGTDTTGNYMVDVSAGSGISVSHTQSEGSTATITNSDKGSSQNIFKNVSDGTTSVVADSNDDTLTLSGGTGITVTANATTDTLTIANSGVISVTGTANEVTVSGTGSDPYTGAVTIGLPDNVTITGDLAVNGGDVTSSATTFNLLNSTVTTLNIGGDATTVSIGDATGTTTVNNSLVVTGDLTVSGTTTTLNTDTLAVEDNIVLLNSNVTGSPSANAGIEVERGTSTNAAVTWDESADIWRAGLAGSEYPIARKYATSINTTAVTAYTVTHGLGTSDVIVQTYSGGSMVECDIDITSSDTITVTTNTAETSLKVVVIG